MQSHINVGTGQDCSINVLAQTIASVVGYQGEIEWDTTKPDGTPRKLMDVLRLEKLGWKSAISLKVGLESTYAWCLRNEQCFRGAD